MNSYPFLDNKLHPITDTELGELVPRLRKNRVIDITDSPLVPASELREKLDSLLRTGELDGGLPILNNNVLVGLIPAPELEYALDKLDAEEEKDDDDDRMCLMSINNPYPDTGEVDESAPTDFTQYIDPVRTTSSYIKKAKNNLTKSLTKFFHLVARRSRYPFSNQPRVPMFRQIGLTLHVRAPQWTICRPCTQEVVCEIHERDGEVRE